MFSTENIDLQAVASQFGTPCYVYSRQAIEHNWQAFSDSFAEYNKPFRIFYAVKANSNLTILKLLVQLGAGFDAVSGGEIKRVLAAGGTAQSIVFSGVGKSSAEIALAIDLGIHCINIESVAELYRVQKIAEQKNKNVNIAFRINPDIYASTHPYMATGNKENKFGIDYTQAIDVYNQAIKLSNLNVTGISCHIGSQITNLEPFLLAIDQLLNIIEELKTNNIHLQHIDVGGGLGICYKDETPPTPNQYVNAIMSKLKTSNLSVHIEPGRSIIANTGILLTRVEYLKSTANNNFAVVDAAMNDLIRPALYDSYHAIQVLTQNNAEQKIYSIVGPVCESGDFLAKDRKLALQAGDLLALENAGAYGYSMSSNYNTRPRAAEVMLDNQRAFLITKRETIEQLLQNEIIPNEL